MPERLSAVTMAAATGDFEQVLWGIHRRMPTVAAMRSSLPQHLFRRCNERRSEGRLRLGNAHDQLRRRLGGVARMQRRLRRALVAQLGQPRLIHAADHLDQPQRKIQRRGDAAPAETFLRSCWVSLRQHRNAGRLLRGCCSTLSDALAAVSARRLRPPAAEGLPDMRAAAAERSRPVFLRDATAIAVDRPALRRTR